MSRQVLNVKIINDSAKNIYQNGSLLKYQTKGSSGFDIRANTVITINNDKIDLNKTEFILKNNMRVQIATGLSFSVDINYEIQIRSRSGLAWKNGIFVLNSPGTIDSDYRGEICVVLFNTSHEDFTIKLGDRIAQAVISKVEKLDFNFVENLDDTIRGSGGYGSTGIN